MNTTVLTSIAFTGFTVAFFHAAIPTHWLPFVLVARARGWSKGRAILVLALAGLGHVGLMTVLGLAIAWAGFRLDQKIGGAFPWIAGSLLFGFAIYYFWRQASGRGICHHNPPGGHHHADEHCAEEHAESHWQDELKDSPLLSTQTGDWTAISGLFVMLTLSPCEGFLPIYLSGVQFGWRGFLVLSLILALATFVAMTLFTWLALVGFDRFRLNRFERYEAGMLGALFGILGLLMIALER